MSYNKSIMDSTYDKAVKIVQLLREAGHIAYFAGGWVRDYLLEQPSPDIDIATSAPPEDVVQLFPHTVQVGVSFGVVMVILEGTPFEVATFRKDGLYLYGRRPENIEYSSPEEDAQRRDFTINGMFYDPIKHEIMDFVGGREDLQKGIIRAIGDPHERFKEDRLRMVRGVRIMARFHFSLERGTRDAIVAHATTLFPPVAKERVWQEFSKMAERPGVGRALVTMHELGLLQVIFPALTVLSLEEIVYRTRPLKDFPHPCPAILCLLTLFSEASKAEFTALCQDLKASNKDIQLAHWYLNVSKMVTAANVSISPEWVNLYADPRTDLCLRIFSATLPKTERQDFLDLHHNAQRSMSDAIDRVATRNPVVTSEHLRAAGILPGKPMGMLLKEAERIAICDSLTDFNSIVDRLKASEYWPREVL